MYTHTVMDWEDAWVYTSYNMTHDEPLVKTIMGNYGEPEYTVIYHDMLHMTVVVGYNLQWAAMTPLSYL